MRDCARERLRGERRHRRHDPHAMMNAANRMCAPAPWRHHVIAEPAEQRKSLVIMRPGELLSAIAARA